MSKPYLFTRSSVDEVSKEILDTLADGEPLEFAVLFDRVYDGLKRRKAGSGSREVLTLRCYERLVKLVKCGRLERKEKVYRLIGERAS